MRYLLLLVFAGLVLFVSSCRNDFEFETSPGGLGFSKDTVYLDTVFTNIGSSTYTLKVYNRSSKNIKIPSIKLGEGEQSKYRLMVDGVPGKVFSDVELMAKDSMFIFIETTIDYTEYANNETTFLYTDKIEFDSGSNYQKVELVTLVQDAVFIKPDRPLDTGIKELLTINGDPSDITGHELTTAEELHWTNEKPYVIYGFALVPNGSTLTVDAGTRVHFHADSGLIVDTEATLEVNGAYSVDPEIMENEVIFEGDRLEPDFADVAGQWNGVYILSGQDNVINHATIKNASVGVFLQWIVNGASPKLTAKNVQVYNSLAFGIWAWNAEVDGENIVINKAGQAGLLCSVGSYSFRHCTFANYSSAYNQVPVLVTDNFQSGDDIYLGEINAGFDNCILYGSSNYGFLLDKKGDSSVLFNYTFNHSFIKFADFNNQFSNDPMYDFAGVHFNGCKIAENSTTLKPDFKDPQHNKLNIGDVSAAKDMADVAVSAIVPNDILNVVRGSDGTVPDVGAYESTVFED